VEPFVRAAPIESNPIDTASAAKPKTEGVGSQGLVPSPIEIDDFISSVLSETRIAPAPEVQKALAPTISIIEESEDFNKNSGNVGDNEEEKELSGVISGDADVTEPETVEGVGDQGLVPSLTEISVASGVFAEAQIAPALKESKTLVPIARIIDGDSGYGSGNNSVVSEDFAVPPFKPEDETGTEIRVYLQKMHRGGSSGPQGP
jgi:hypothetical protein